MKKLKQTKGITLVALVVTIIILLILAGISIRAITNTGLFKQAQNAKNLTEEKTAEENAILTNYLEQMNAIIGGQVTESIPDGAVVTPINDITTWLKTGGISKQYSYTTIEQVIADSTCTESLMNNENAMKYLTRSTEFADAICTSETAMTYLGQSAYVDDTVLNSDIWKQKIKASQYWSLVYQTKQVTVYGGAYETITIEGYYNSSFITNADGSCSHEVPIDTITLKGSVSGKSFTRTVTNETTEVKVMPDGLVLYWYGNECDCVAVTTEIVSSSTSYCRMAGFATKGRVDAAPYTKYNSIISKGNQYMSLDLHVLNDNCTSRLSSGMVRHNTEGFESIDINFTQTGRICAYCGVTNGSSYGSSNVVKSTNYVDLNVSSYVTASTRVHAIWLE